MLTPYTLAPYLQARGLIDQRSVVDGRLQIVDASRRNYNFKVVCGDRAYMVKQGVGPGRAATIRNEAAVYRLLSTDPARSSESTLEHSAATYPAACCSTPSTICWCWSYSKGRST